MPERHSSSGYWLRVSGNYHNLSILKILKIGNPLLRKKALVVPEEAIERPETQKIIDDMIETMRAADGVGLAGPQVGISRRIFVMEVQENPRYPGRPDYPLKVVINPKITILSDKKEAGDEGCLSVPELRGMVPRFSHLKIEAFDRYARPMTLELNHFPARIVQHEMDHLEGKFFLDRLPDNSSLTTLEELLKNS